MATVRQQMRIIDIPTDPTPAHLVEPKIKLHAIIKEADCLLRMIAKDDPRYEQLALMPIDRIRKLTKPIRMGLDCKTCRRNGQTFHFGDEQAAVVAILWKAYLAGRPRMHERTIVARWKPEAFEIGQTVRILTAFNKHPALDVVLMHDDGWWWIG